MILVGEVVSPESEHRDRTVKLRKSAEAGIKHGPRLADLDRQHEQAGAPTQERGGIKEWSWPLPVKLRIIKGTLMCLPVLSGHNFDDHWIASR